MNLFQLWYDLISTLFSAEIITDNQATFNNIAIVLTVMTVLIPAVILSKWLFSLITR